MEEFIGVVGETIATGIIETIYAILMDEIRKTSSYGDQMFAPPLDVYEGYEEELRERFGLIIKIENNKVDIARPLTTDDDEVFITINKSKYDIYSIQFIFEINGSVDEFETIAKGMSTIINYGTDKLKRLVKKKLIAVFNGLIEDTWLFILQNIQIGVNLENNVLPLQFKLKFKFTNESDIRPGGVKYLETAVKTKIGKKI